MTPQVFTDYESLSQHAAGILIECLCTKPDLLLCLAAGATPARTYSLVAEHFKVEPELFERVRVMKLDEWGGLAMDDRGSCEQFLRQTFVEPLGLSGRYVGFDSRPVDPEVECGRVAGWLKQHGPIDLCVLGLGVNGHLGFNEPGPHLTAHAHVARLSSASLQHSMLDQAGVRPTCGLTLGMADLLQARRIVLLVSGKAKSVPLRALLSGQISAEFPASFLWLHSDVMLLCDNDAMQAGQ